MADKTTFDIRSLVLPVDPGTLGGFLGALIKMLTERPEIAEYPLIHTGPDGELTYVQGYSIEVMESSSDTMAIFIDFGLSMRYHPDSEHIQ